jgi:serine/threonine protein kinase/WD40 repeat protein/tetratricopeptide (TPR) repeat protein
MGIVYRAWQPSLGRHVALKLLLNTGDTKAEARFTREIYALGRVDHPNLVKTYTSGSDGEHWFYAMELVEGATLAAICETIQSSCPGASRVNLDTWRSSLSSACENARQAERPILAVEPRDLPRTTEARPTWTPARPEAVPSYARHVAELVRQVAGAAHALHRAGVVHRDIKPGNIMVTVDGRQAVLMDLGLAQLADDVHGKLTRTRQFVGTLRYASPEQVLAVGGVDLRTDVYSLGASLWELLTLRPMFGATEQTPTPELMQRIQYEEPDSVRRYHTGVTRDLEAIVHKCLAKDPKRRYATAAELADDLQRFLDGESVMARRELLAQRLWRKAWRRPAATTLGLLTFATVVALAIIVPRAITAQRSADFAARLDELIERGDLSGPELDKIDDLTVKLERINPKQAAVRRKTIANRLVEKINEDIFTQPTVEPEDEARLRARITQLAARDAEMAKELERHLDQRVSSWQEIARIEPPYDSARTAFDPTAVKIDERGIGPNAPDSPPTAPASATTIFLPSQVASQGNVRLDVTLRAGTWENARKIGLFLYDNEWHTSPIRGLAFAGNRKLVIIDERRETRLWDIQAHSGMTLTPPSASAVSLAFGLPGWPYARKSDVDAPQLQDAELGKLMQECRSARIGQLVLAVAPEGRAVALAAPGGRVTLFGTREGAFRRIREYQLQSRDVLCLALSGNGKRIAVGARDGSISLLDADSDTPPVVMKGQIREVNALAFQREGKLLASGGADALVRLWDVSKASQKSALPGHQGKITALAFDANGQTLASGGVDSTVRLWNLATEQSGVPLTGHSPGVSSLAFSTDEKTLAVAHDDQVTIWDTRTSRSLELLRPQHYGLELVAPRSDQSFGSRRITSPSISLGDAIAANRPLTVQLTRDGSLLREQDVTLTSRGALTLSGRLDRGKLELLVNDSQQVLFQDVFPLGRTGRGVFALELPQTARIERLVASRQRPPERPSWIERGDDRYASGELRLALDAYRAQVRDLSSTVQVIQEAKYKEGVCLSSLGETDAAMSVFEQLESETGDRWPVIAGCRLWLLYLKEKKLQEADAVYARLSSQRRLERIAGLVPADIPAEILDAYAPSSVYSQIVHDPNLVRNLSLALDIAKGVRAPADQQATIKWRLAEAYHQDGQLDLATRTYAELLAGPPLSQSDEAAAMQYYSWVLGLLKKNDVAIEELDKRLASGVDVNPLFFICRAQVRARQGQWIAAKNDIDEYFRLHKEEYEFWLYEACLTRGFIREALGDASGARESWRYGYRAASGTADMGLLQVSILASLSEELTPEDSRIMFNTVVTRLPTTVAPMNIIENAGFRFADIASATRTLWTTARGRNYARKIVLRDISRAEYFGIQVPLAGAEVCRHGAFGGTLTPEDDELVWTTVQKLYWDYLDHKLKDLTYVGVMTTWMGLPLTWPVARGAMAPETRALTAYVMGFRYRQLGLAASARSFFQTAQHDSRPGTLLRRRAEAALELPNASK